MKRTKDRPGKALHTSSLIFDSANVNFFERFVLFDDYTHMRAHPPTLVLSHPTRDLRTPFFFLPHHGRRQNHTPGDWVNARMGGSSIQSSTRVTATVS